MTVLGDAVVGAMYPKGGRRGVGCSEVLLHGKAGARNRGPGRNRVNKVLRFLKSDAIALSLE